MEKKLTPMKAIRAKCLDCCAGSNREVRLCNIPQCPLFPYRFGKRPAAGKNTDGDRQGEKVTASYRANRQKGHAG